MKKVISLVIVLILMNPFQIYSIPVDKKAEYISHKTTSAMTYVWDYFINKGIDPIVVAGVMGNMQIESGFSHNVRNASGHAGYVQMNRTLQKLIIQKYGHFGKDTQLQHLSNWLLCKETGKLSYMQQAFSQADNSTPEKAAHNFAKYYERPKSKNYTSRQKAARWIYESFK